MSGNTGMLGGRQAGLTSSDIRQILEALNEIGGSSMATAIVLAADPTQVATAAGFATFGTYDGDLFLHVTEDADTKWLNVSALQNDAAGLAALVNKSLGLLLLEAQGTNLLALNEDRHKIQRLLLLNVDLVAHFGEGYGDNVNSRRAVIMDAMPAGAVVTSVYGAIGESLVAPGLETAVVSFGWNTAGDPEAALAELNATNATDNNSTHGHAAMPMSVGGLKLDVSLHMTGATGVLTAGEVRVIVGYTVE